MSKKHRKAPQKALDVQRTLEPYTDHRHRVSVRLRRPDTFERAEFEESVPRLMQAVHVVVVGGAKSAGDAAHIPVSELRAAAAWLHTLIDGVESLDTGESLTVPDDYVAMSGPGPMFNMLTHVMLHLLLADMGVSMTTLVESARGN